MTELIKDLSFFQSFFSHYNCLKTPIFLYFLFNDFSGKIEVGRETLLLLMAFEMQVPSQFSPRCDK